MPIELVTNFKILTFSNSLTLKICRKTKRVIYKMSFFFAKTINTQAEIAVQICVFTACSDVP